MSALGQKQTYAVHQAMSALLPKATAKADFPQTVRSLSTARTAQCYALAGRKRACTEGHS
jgi:hypothetical protein